MISSDNEVYAYINISKPTQKSNKRTICIVPDLFDSSNKLLYAIQNFVNLGYKIVLVEPRQIHSDLLTSLCGSGMDKQYLNLLQAERAKQKDGQIILWSLGSGNILATQILQQIKLDYWISEAFILHPSYYVPQVQRYFGQNFKPDISDKQYIDNYLKIKTPQLNFYGKLDFIVSAYEMDETKKLKPSVVQYGHVCQHLMGLNCLTKSSYGDQYINLIEQFVAGKYAALKQD